MQISRTRRRRLVSALAVLMFAGALVGFHLESEERAEPGQVSDRVRWPDMAAGCAQGGYEVEDEKAAEAHELFFEGSPQLMAASGDRAAAAAIFRSQDGKAIAICTGASPDTYTTSVHPFRSTTREDDLSPVAFHVACSNRDRCRASLVVVDRLNPKVSRMVVQLEGDKEVVLRPQRGTWIARTYEVPVKDSRDETPVERVVYLDGAGKPLAEWLPPHSDRERRLPSVSDFPGVEQDCLYGADC